MGVSQLTDIGSELDKLLGVTYGKKTLGAIVTDYGDDASSFTEAQQTEIAKLVYLYNRNKWDSLLEFVDENISPWLDQHKVVTTTYGKNVSNTASGEDTATATATVAGYDSADFVDSDKNVNSTKYGKGTKEENTGTDTVETDVRNQQAEKLVDYTMRFWSQYGITRTVLADTKNTICLPLYESEVLE